ncbi:baseplate J/gp47 family protein [Phaeovibrio sulfidiphilus]|uniref:Baseplate J/gp47 family protein n=1 Tax=Phaeovibrio sulfidiphilus TaxID=1220600 RepID=A0A8J6YPW4_9PROT|nr:baseplate J/gp47 family protein [Phaeovibrio sulfidiphilus]MBE1237496.1 baseplate J/gp47 family protein [Phaeovibrio sulfidiphilus]
MPLIFDPTTGLRAESTDVIRERVRAAWVNAFGREDTPPLETTPDTPAGQLVDSETVFIAEKDAQLLALASQFDPQTADGIFQEALASLYFLTRKSAQPSVITVVCRGLPGTVIPRGARVMAAGNLTFSALSAEVIGPSGTAEILFSCDTPGPVAVPARLVTGIVTTIPGWDSAENPAPGVPGRHEETRHDFETRRAASVARNGHGTLASLYGALADLNGVLDLCVLENTGPVPVVKWGVTIPGHSVFASIYGGGDRDIAEVFYRKKDAGCGTAGDSEITWVDHEYGGALYTYRIQRPTPLSFRFRVTLRPTVSTPADIEALARKALVDAFNGESGSRKARIASSVYATTYVCPVVSAGIQNLVSLQVATDEAPEWAGSVVVPADRVPVLTEASISFASV